MSEETQEHPVQEFFKEIALKSLVTRRNVSFWNLYAKISECVRYSPR